MNIRADLDKILGTDTVLHLTGAYGRETSIKDWEDGQDFKIVGGPYCSKRDLALIKNEGYTEIQFWSKLHYHVATFKLEHTA